MPSTYIVDGRVERRSRLLGVRTHFLQYFSWHRLVFLLVVAGTLIATNPANMELFQKKSAPSSKSSFFSTLLWGAVHPGVVTNYLFFSVQEIQDALVFTALRESWACRYNDLDIGFVCDMLTPVLSHGKPVLWDDTDPAHTAHRLICWLLILSSAASFCCPGCASDGRLFDNPVFDSLFSVFYRPHLMSDLFHQSLAVYPALVELQHVLPRLRTDSVWSVGDPDVDFAIMVALFVLGIGGGSNFIASQLLPKGHCVSGFSSVVAASMAYCQRIRVLGPLVLFRFDVISVTTADLYWTELALIFLRSSTRKAFPLLLAWLIAGALGTALAKYQLENLAIWGGIYKLFG